MEKEAEQTHCNDRTAEQFLAFIRQKKLEIPTLFALELYRPLVLIGDSLLVIFNPFLKALLIPERFLGLFRDRVIVESLIKQLQTK